MDMDTKLMDRPNPPVDEQEEETNWRSLVFFQKLDEDVWEAWAWTAVGLMGATAMVWLVSFLKLGMPSIKAYVLIPWTGVMVLPIVVWGLIRSLLNPPIFRVSRSVAFVCLMVVGLSANTPLFSAPVSTEDWKPSTIYKLPIKDTWYTIAGGDDLKHNVLATSPAMRYGVMLTKTKDNKRFTNQGKDLKDYYCYGAPVYAPAAGEVVEIYDKIKDNAPNAEPKKGYQGNFVVLKIKKDVFFFLFGLKHQSIAVKQGDKVTPGQKLGECGNTGATKQPQIQFHFQNSAAFPLSEGLPVRFDFKVGQDVKNNAFPLGETDKPNSGQLISPL